MEWSILNNSVKKGLFIIMQRALIPIEISTAYILTLNLDSFVSVSKKIGLYDIILIIFFLYLDLIKIIVSISLLSLKNLFS